MSDNIIKIGPLTKFYSDDFGRNINLFENLSFEIDVNKVTVIVAKKGSGKSSLLQTISDETNIQSAKGKRVIIPTFPSSFPWLNVTENIKFNLKNLSTEEITEAINFVGLEGYEDHFPNNKSTAFRFRISLARAIVNKPELILIDDSLSALPRRRRIKLFALLRKLTAEKGIPILYATSSITEAIRLADTVIVLSNSPAKVISRKNIFIDEQIRSDEKTFLNITDYFGEEEISLFDVTFF